MSEKYKKQLFLYKSKSTEITASYILQERTISPQRKRHMKMDAMVSGDRTGDVGKYIQKRKVKIMLFGNGFFRKKDINSTYD